MRSNFEPIHLKKANELGISLKHKEINPEHLVYGLILQKGSIAAEILIQMGLNAERIRNSVENNNKSDAVTSANPATIKILLSPHTKKFIFTVSF